MRLRPTEPRRLSSTNGRRAGQASTVAVDEVEVEGGEDDDTGVFGALTYVEVGLGADWKATPEIDADLVKTCSIWGSCRIISGKMERSSDVLIS